MVAGKAIALLLGAGFLPSLPASGQVPDVPTAAVTAAPPDLHEVRGRLLERVARGQWPSFAVGLVRGDVVEWEEAIGWADREARAPATPNTRYAVASVSKSITATGAGYTPNKQYFSE